MKLRCHHRAARRAESGYALIMIMFMLAMLILIMTEAAPTVLSSIQREKEAEMVWRGKQYTRGIRMYYLKMNRFPTSLDDLTKPKTGIRFMRQAYKDPMNDVDGSWRLIYVGPNGQLIGSLSDRTISINGVGSPMPGAQGVAGAGSSMLSGGSGTSLTNFGSNSPNSASLNSSGFGANPPAGIGQTGAVGTALANGTVPTNSTGNADDGTIEDPTQPHSLVGSMDGSNTIGGNIIGVGSKVNKKSFLIYEKAKVYRKFEFIWDPSKDTTVGRASAGIGTAIGNSNGMTPAGGTGMSNSPFSNGINPGQTPTQNPSPSPSPNPNNPTPDPNQIPPLQAPPPG
jgi:hypothetical protein